MRLSLDKWYQVDDLYLHDVIITVVKVFRVYLVNHHKTTTKSPS